MTRLSLKSLLIIVVLLLVGITGLWQIQRRARPAAAGWFSDAWQYRKAINIGYTGATALTDFQVSVDIGTSALIAAGKMKSDCNDIRFTDQNGNLLNYWIEENNPGCNQLADTKIWLKIPRINTTGTNIYLYYGNSSATSFQDGNKVFEFFDDFNDGTSGQQLSTTKWPYQTTGWKYISDGNNKVVGYSSGSSQFMARAINDIATTGSVIYEANIKGISGKDGFFISNATSDTSSNFGYFYWTGWGGSGGQIQIGKASGSTGSGINTSYNSIPTSYTNIKTIYHSNQITFNNGSGSTLVATDSSYTNGYSGIGTWYQHQNSTYWNWIFVRKYAPSDPTKTLLAEERSLAPIAHWSFDEGVGTSAFDGSSNRNNGAITGATWLTDDMCITGKCLKFSTASNYVSMSTSAPELGTSNFTISVWAYFGDSTYQWQRLAGKKAQAAAAAGYSIYYGGDTGKLMWSTANGSTANEYWTTATFTRNTWHHIVMVRNSSDSRVGYFYVDGKRYEITNIPSVLDISSPSQNFTVGAMTNGALQFKGYIDEPKVYAYARTAAQIKQDYRAGLSGMKTQKGSSVAMGGSSAGKSLSDGLVGYWKMDEGVGTTTADSSGNGYTGSYSTNAGWSSGKFGIGMSFWGEGGLSTGFTTPLNDFTVSVWFKDDGNIRSFERLVDKNHSSGFWIGRNSNRANSWGSGIIATSDPWGIYGTFPDNSWNHLVSLRRGDKQELYANGVLTASTTVSTTPLDTTIIRIGTRGSSDQWFNGLIDEVRVYNRALNPAEVTALYEYAPGPIAYYNFEEGVGTTAFDKSGNGNNFVWNGTLGSQWKSGKIGSAGYFNGSNNYLINSVISNPQHQMTVSAWIKTSGGFGNYGGIVSHHYNQFRLCKDHDRTPGTEYSFEWNGQWSVGIGISESLIEDNKWHYLTGVYDGSYIRNYLDGKEINKYAYTGTIASPYYGLVIGRQYYGTNNYYFNGSIDEVKIYNYARTQKQILQDMNASAPVGGMSKINKPIAHYKFDEGYGTVVNNSGSIGNTINGTFGPGTSAPTWVTGKSGKGLSFDGNDYIYKTDWTNSPLDVTNITLSAWIYPTVIDNAERMIFEKYYGAGWEFSVDRSGLKVNAMHGGVYESNFMNTNNNGIIAANKWHHVVWTYDGILSKLFVNGKNVASVGKTGDLAVNNGTLYIGSRGASYGYFQGIIDEPKIYNYALSEDEIKQDYNQGATAVIGKSNQTIGATTTSLDYCIPGDTSHCAAPIAEYNFEEGVGTTAYDKSGNGKHGVWQGTLGSQWKAGKIGSAGNFNGTNNYTLGTSNLGISGDAALTMCAWMKWTGSSWSANYPSFMGNNSIAGNQGLSFTVKDGKPSVDFINNRWRATNTLSVNTWYYICGTKTPGAISTTSKIYVNGQLVSGAVEGTDTSPNIIDSPSIIGRLDGTRWFQGLVDQVRYYNYARTPAQIAYDYNKGAPIGWWKMDECQGTTINDSSGNNNHGTLNIGAGGSQTAIGTCQSSGAWYNGRTGKINSAMSFDGTDDYVSISDKNEFTFSTVSFSASAWVYLDTIDLSSNEKVIIGKADYGNNQREWVFGIARPSDSVCENNVGGGYGLWSSPTLTYTSWTGVCDTNTPELNKWHHIVGTVSDGTGKIYIDGKLVKTRTSMNSVMLNGTANLTIGGVNSGGSALQNIDGKIDDVRIYNYALTSEQVKQVYNGGAMNFR